MNATSKILGAAASAAWIEARGLDATRVPHWYVEITVESDSLDTRFELNIYPEEWGFVFRRGTRVSSIRVTDLPFVHGPDEYQLLAQTPELGDIVDLLDQLERRFDLTFQRYRATVRSNLVRAAAVVRPWLAGSR
jgi:hypothetical protein